MKKEKKKEEEEEQQEEGKISVECAKGGEVSLLVSPRSMGSALTGSVDSTILALANTLVKEVGKVLYRLYCVVTHASFHYI